MSEQLKVLCVDDNQEAALATAQLFSRAGCDVLVCDDAESALATAEGFQPDVCILDVLMPGMDGIELLRKLREQANGRPLRSIALTGLWDISTRHQTRNAGFDEHLIKPVDPEMLVEMVTGKRLTTINP